MYGSLQSGFRVARKYIIVTSVVIILVHNSTAYRPPRRGGRCAVQKAFVRIFLRFSRCKMQERGCRIEVKLHKNSLPCVRGGGLQSKTEGL